MLKFNDTAPTLENKIYGITVKTDTVFPLDLARNEVKIAAYMAYVYKDEYQGIINNIDNFLHDSELEYFNSIKSEKRRFSYLSGRFSGKLAVSEFLHEIDMKGVEIRSGIFDQPLVKHLSTDTPELTLTHCSDLAIAIAYQAGHIMGVDVEDIDFSKSHVFKSQLTEREVARAENSFEDLRIGYHLMWTAKEALSKVLKCGLTVPFDILEIEECNPIEKTAYLSLYKNFVQYKCCSWIMDGYLLSITLPRKTDIQLDIPSKIIRGHAQQTSSI